MDKKAAYVFVKRCDPTNMKHSHERIVRVYSHDTNLPELLEAFEDFLRSCGFAVDMGSLTILEDEP